MARIFQDARRRFAEPALQIAEAIAAQHQFAYGTARLQYRDRVSKTATVIVDLVPETKPQRVARMIEPLLRVAHPIEQLAAKTARAALEVANKINHVAHDQLGGGARCWRTQIGHEIGNREIDLVSNRRDDGYIDARNYARDDLLVELP